MTEQVTSNRVRCPLCSERVLASELAEHLEQCMRREKFE